MERVIGLDGVIRDESSVVTVGTFDGVHIGHQAILKYLIERAKLRGGTSVVVTFDPHPREVVHNETVPLLTTVPERADAMEAIGIERLIVIPFTEKFSSVPAEDFVEKILVNQIGMREVVVGYDHAFGKARTGNRQLLEIQGKRYGFNVDVIPAASVQKKVVSSTRIRELIRDEGNVSAANLMIGRRYSMQGVVIRGEARGRIIGFPTANISVDFRKKLIPKEGVYAVRVRLEPSNKMYGGMMNIGRRPTFGGSGIHLEVHLFNFSGDLYDTSVALEFVKRLRDERKFESVDELKKQLYVDRSRCKEVLNEVN